VITDFACPCRSTTPCVPGCTCVEPYSSRGCRRCASYGSAEQRRAKAEWLAKAIDAAYEASRRPEGRP
jgi:hypothetical protein